jgi:flagellin
MGLNVISNYAANVAHRNLERTDMEASQSLAKLSSGTRVVSAKDDAASLAIGSRLGAEVQGLRQATINAGQAISMLQIADGAMSQVNDIMIRMKTLSIQAASGQLSDTERGMLDTEYQALLSEVDRIAADTEFNGNQLINGSDTVNTALNGMPTGDDNLLEAADGFHNIEFTPAVGDAAFDIAYDSSTGVMTVRNLTTGESQGVNLTAGSAIPTNEEQIVIFDNVGTTITLNNAFDKTSNISNTGGSFVAVTGDIDTNSIRIISSTDDGAQSLSSLSTTIDATAAASAIVTMGGFSAVADLSSTGQKTLTMSDGTDNFVVEFSVSTAFSNGESNDSLEVNGLGAMVFGDQVTGSGLSTFTFKLGTGVVSNVDNVSLSVSAVNNNALGLTASSIDTAANSETAVGVINNAIDTLNVARADIGATQNRIEFANANLRISTENAEAARSQLMDLDVALEMSNFTSKQVLLQAGVSMLAQANQMPQNLLQLLQG